MRPRAAAVVAVVFGVATMLAGSRVLAGADPGYVVFRPLLLYNTLMGVVYLAAGIFAWRDPRRGRIWAGAVLVLNVTVLIGIAALYAGGWAVALESLGAMTFRTAVWVGLFLMLSRPGPASTADVTAAGVSRRPAPGARNRT